MERHVGDFKFRKLLKTSYQIAKISYENCRCRKGLSVWKSYPPRLENATITDRLAVTTSPAIDLQIASSTLKGGY